MTDDAVTATSEEMLMDKYADRMIKIVKRSLNQVRAREPRKIFMVA